MTDRLPAFGAVFVMNDLGISPTLWHLRPSLNVPDDSGPETRNPDGILDLLDYFECGGIMLAHSKTVLGANRTAVELLSYRHQPIGAALPAQVSLAGFASLLRDAAPELVRDPKVTSAAIEREGRPPLIIAQLPIKMTRERTVLIVVDLHRIRHPSASTLQQIFGLTPAEVVLTCAMAGGTAPSEFASGCAVSRSTVRSHLREVFSKTNTHRQAELVSLLCSAGRIP